jgi:DNA-binding winged helix-turn-helix (wHTH) protein/Flp pilus assembly protein TadD
MNGCALDTVVLSTQFQPEGQVLRFGSFLLDIPRRTLLHAADSVALAPKEIDVLIVLALLSGQLVTKDDLALHAWGGEAVSDSALFQTVYRLRRALARHDRYEEYIATVPGRGYQFTARVQAADSSSARFDIASEAFSLYSRAMFEFHQRTQESLTASIALFRQALRRDPHFVPAYVGLAHAHLCAGVALFADHAYSYHRALRACRAALALDPQYGDAHAILSEIYVFFEAEIEKAQRTVRTAIALAPNSPRVLTAAFWAFLTANEIPQALEYVREGLVADPSSNHFTTLLGVAQYYARRFEDAHAHLLDAHLFRPADSMALFYDACALCFLGDYEGAQARLAQREPADRAARALAVQAWIAARRGAMQQAHAIAERLISASRVDDIAVALALTAVDRLDDAAAHARRALRSKQTSCYLIPLDPLFEPLSAHMG